MIYFLVSLNQVVFMVGDFNSNTLKSHQDKKNFKKLLKAFDIEDHKFEPAWVKNNLKISTITQ